MQPRFPSEPLLLNTQIGCSLLFVTHYPQVSLMIEESAAAIRGPAIVSNGCTTDPNVGKEKQLGREDEAADASFVERDAVPGCLSRAVNAHMSYVETGDDEISFMYKAVRF